MENADGIFKIFSKEIKTVLYQAELSLKYLQEIRLRAEKPLVCVYQGEEIFLTAQGKQRKTAEDSFRISKEMLLETVSYIARYSIYAFEEELRQGYLTLPGGHRVGIAGKAVMEDGRIRCMKYISFLNIRLAHEKKGCADSVLPYLVENGVLCHTLIISPPRCGKTTLLRDIIRQASNGNELLKGMNVGVVDERSEIGGCFQGIPQNDLGIRTDVLDGCPKAEGMMLLIRSMAPDIVAVDEIGDRKDGQALEAVFHCGCRLLATVHGSSMEDIQRKPLLQQLIQEQFFQRYVILDREKQVGHIRAVLDERGTRLDVDC